MLNLLRHALGLDISGVSFKNDYLADKISIGYKLCDKAVQAGLMEQVGPTYLDYGMFKVTEAGRKYVEEHSEDRK